jgi:hypothetical protein
VLHSFASEHPFFISGVVWFIVLSCFIVMIQQWASHADVCCLNN